MKKLVAIVLSGSLVCAVSFLGGTGTAASNVTESPTANDTPTVTGELLNPAFFAHGAYVMQGVSDPAKAFALPLLGVPGLGLVPTISGADPTTVTWTVAISHPEGIGAEIRDSVLYIWGSSTAWSGYGEVVLTGTAPIGASGSVTIPVTVFGVDRTLTDDQGDTTFFVPWNPQLDINRILSVRRHTLSYGRADSARLDPTILFSAWRKLNHVKGAIVTGWLNQYMFPLFSREALWRQVDETFHELARIGCNGVMIWRDYYNPSPTASCPVEDFDYWTPGLSMTDEEVAYVVNEAHLQGFYVLLAPNVAESPEGRYFRPPSVDQWFGCYAQLVAQNARIAESLGADSFCMANILAPAGFEWPSYPTRYADWMRFMGGILADTRPAYSGPVVYMPGSFEVRDPWQNITTFLKDVDIVGANSNFIHLTQSQAPTVEELRTAMEQKCRSFFVPVYTALRKPMFVNEGFTCSYDGAIRGFDLSSAPPPTAVYDEQEQADWYRAYFETADEFGFLLGFGWANWGFWPSGGGAGDLGANPRLKETERVIAEAYGAPDPFATILVDGDASDWSKVATRIADPSTDSRIRGNADLLSLAVTSDDAYLYLAVFVSSRPGSLQTVEVDLDTDGNREADLPIGIFAITPTSYRPTRRWMGILYEAPMNFGAHRAVVDVATSVDDTLFEIRVSRYFLPATSLLSMRALLVDREKQMVVDETSWVSYRLEKN